MKHSTVLLVALWCCMLSVPMGAQPVGTNLDARSTPDHGIERMLVERRKAHELLVEEIKRDSDRIERVKQVSDELLRAVDDLKRTKASCDGLAESVQLAAKQLLDEERGEKQTQAGKGSLYQRRREELETRRRDLNLCYYTVELQERVALEGVENMRGMMAELQYLEERLDIRRKSAIAMHKQIDILKSLYAVEEAIKKKGGLEQK